MSIVKSLVVSGCVFCLVIVAASANDIKVENMEALRRPYPETVAEVKFDISWENSWSNGLNWDAAWVFVKYRAPRTNVWQHAMLSTVAEDHDAPAGCMVEPASDGTGVFIRSDSVQTGAVSFAEVNLLWDFGATDLKIGSGETIDISVHAIEMVFVPEGAFYLGSGGTEFSTFTDGAWQSGDPIPIPFLVGGEGALTLAPTAGNLWATGDTGSAGNLPAEYPKGYGAFYCMKFSITQGQYAEFLNELSPLMATNRYQGKFGADRYTITNEAVSGKFTAVAPDRACNYISWPDGSAYLAWAGLRPMTELEFEKACRGSASPVPDEFAWGSTRITSLNGYDGVEGSGSETPLPVNANSTFYYGSNAGPVRVGLFARPDADRETSGASYWGIFDLTGNVWEWTVSVANDAARTFTGVHGTGNLTRDGLADVAGWPSPTVYAPNSGAGYRGRSTHENYMHFRVSSRYDTLNRDNAGRHRYGGCRGVRTAP